MMEPLNYVKVELKNSFQFYKMKKKTNTSTFKRNDFISVCHVNIEDIPIVIPLKLTGIRVTNIHI